MLLVPDIPWMPPSPQAPQEWFSWEEQVLEHRLTVQYETNQHSKELRDQARAREIQRCKESDLYLIATYGTIYEARPDESSSDEGSAFYIPFIPYPFQIEFIQELNLCLTRTGPEGDIADLKSRDMGISNCICFWVACGWMNKKPFSTRMLSRVEKLVDNIGDPDSLFWKIETFLKGLPAWLFQGLVPGFRWKDHRKVMMFINPTNANLISGESTQSNAGRGGRATVIIYDEAAFMPNFAAIWTAGRASTRHRIAVTTASIDEGLDFYNIWSGKGGYESPKKIKQYYNLHPLHDLAWLDSERKRDSEDGIQREIFMNFFAGSTGQVYPEAGSKNPGDFPFTPGDGPIYATIDDGFDDDFAIVWIQYVNRTGRFRIFQGYKNSHKVTGFYGSLLKGVPESQFDEFYGTRERDIMQRQQELPPISYTADPHLKNTEALVGTSPMEHLMEKYGINAFTTLKGNSHRQRRLALGTLLPLMDFHDEDGAPDVLEAVQRYRFKETPSGSSQMTEYKTPLHDKWSHFVTALEWFATNWDSIKISDSYQNVQWTGKPAA
jgi:hypothetical protein